MLHIYVYLSYTIFRDHNLMKIMSSTMISKYLQCYIYYTFIFIWLQSCKISVLYKFSPQIKAIMMI